VGAKSVGAKSVGAKSVGAHGVRTGARVLMLAGLVAALAAPVAASTVVYRSPGNEETITSAPTITADVYVGSPVVPGQKLRLTVEGAKESAVREVSATNACQRVSETVPLRHNGRYEVRIVADPALPAAGAPSGSCAGSSAESLIFFLAAPPARPGQLKATLDPRTRAANVSWARNPEPDVVGYRVQRARPNGGFEAVGADTAQTSISDPATAQGGGDYRYQVIAVRSGRTDKDLVASPPSAAVTLKVPGASAPASSGSRSGVAGGAIAGIDVARFEAEFDRLLGKAGGGPAGPEGFEDQLPYTESGDRDEELGADEERGSRRSLPYVAGGLLVLDTFLVLRSVRAQVNRLPLTG
jgi:hypothetical protein